MTPPVRFSAKKAASSATNVPAKRVSTTTRVSSAAAGHGVLKSSGRVKKRTSRQKSATYQPDRRAAFVVGVLGNRASADLLGVAPSQTSRWKSGAELPGPDTSALLVDLDHVLGRLLLVWDEEVAYGWLTGSNSFLDGARPIDVLAQRGSSEVVEAIEAEAAGAYG